MTPPGKEMAHKTHGGKKEADTKQGRDPGDLSNLSWTREAQGKLLKGGGSELSPDR